MIRTLVRYLVMVIAIWFDLRAAILNDNLLLRSFFTGVAGFMISIVLFNATAAASRHAYHRRHRKEVNGYLTRDNHEVI